jgi:hypothetical protein
VRFAPFQDMRQARTEVYWTIQDYEGVHVSQLKKCLCVLEEQIPMEDLDAKGDLSYQVYPVKILETSERVNRNKWIKKCKVQWSHHIEEEATWEREEELKAEFLSFFFYPSESQGRDSF